MSDHQGEPDDWPTQESPRRCRRRDSSPWESVYAVGCPSYAAAPLLACRTRYGIPAMTPHVARIRATN